MSSKGLKITGQEIESVGLRWYIMYQP